LDGYGGQAPFSNELNQINRSKNMKIVLSLLSLVALPLCASDEPKDVPAAQENTSAQQREFESNKAQLPASLKGFVSDFATWPKEDKAKIEISGLSFMVSGLSEARKAPYEGNVGLWIDCRTRTQAQRVAFINCLQHLKK
jgi:hypothetical protein